MVNVGDKYECDLILYPDPVRTYQNIVSGGMRSFLRSLRRSSRQEQAKEVLQNASNLAVPELALA